MARRKKAAAAEGPAIVRFLRRDTVGGVTYSPGQFAEVPRKALPRILGGHPPFGELVEDLEAATAPEEEAESEAPAE